MFTGIYQSIAILLVILIFYAMDFLLMRRFDRLRQAAGSGRAWDFTLLVLALAVPVILRPIFLTWLGFSSRNVWGLVIQITGILLAAMGLALHAWARLHLRHFYAERVQIHHQVISIGPDAAASALQALPGRWRRA